MQPQDRKLRLKGPQLPSVELVTQARLYVPGNCKTMGMQWSNHRLVATGARDFLYFILFFLCFVFQTPRSYSPWRQCWPYIISNVGLLSNVQRY